VLTLEDDGAELVTSLLSDRDIRNAIPIFDSLATTSAGFRIAVRELEHIGLSKCITSLAARELGPNARAVRALLFDKHEANNWALGWHQDRTIAVKERKEVHGFGPWTIKAGTPHVAPPFALLERMVTVRVHFDAVDQDNAPLLVAPSSHRLGLIAERDIASVVAECGEHTCLAEAGDVWIYATPILHASARAVHPRRRRVLQIDYSADNLPGGLEWAADA
jgi:Phytanoyl-CoA dioxygenase (PhyH)